MTDSLIRGLSVQRYRYAVRPLRSPQAIAEQLRPERLFAAYALAQLEPNAFPLSEWWTCDTPQGHATICHSRGGLGDATVALGPADGVAVILSLHPGQYQTFATSRPEHLPALERVYRMAAPRVMRRMLVRRDSFLPAPGPSVRLLGHQVRALNRLYSSEGGPTSYQPQHLEEGLYRGIVEDGLLVAVAGTHAISPTHSIAVVGNVFTHPDHRGRGHATIATSAVTEDLLQQCREVVLSVDPSNTPAIHAYERLGYRDVGAIVEAGARRSVGGLPTALRRLAARLRGRGEGTEVVLG